MSTYISQSIQTALDEARLISLRKKNRLRVRAGEEVYPLLRLWKDGFSVAETDAPGLRGLVDVYDGARHLMQCLIVTSDTEGGETCYEFKRATPAVEQAPVDFFRDPEAPVGLLTS